MKSLLIMKKYLFDSDNQIHTQVLRYIAIHLKLMGGRKNLLDLLKQEQNLF